MIPSKVRIGFLAGRLKNVNEILEESASGTLQEEHIYERTLCSYV